MNADLQTPLTEIELATLTKACQDVLSPAGQMLLRRLAFERDILRDAKNLAHERDGQVAQLAVALKMAIDMIGGGFHATAGGSGEITWAVCAHCEGPEWDGHKADCVMGRSIDVLKQVLATHGKLPSGEHHD
jgi:hypothetical protein